MKWYSWVALSSLIASFLAVVVAGFASDPPTGVERVVGVILVVWAVVALVIIIFGGCAS